MVRNPSTGDYTPVRITGLLVEHQQLYAVLAIGAGTKLLPCDAADLIDGESFEHRAQEYFGVAYRLVGDWKPAVASAMRQAVAA